MGNHGDKEYLVIWDLGQVYHQQSVLCPAAQLCVVLPLV